eukprot:CAMPEP_0171500488 /NCGR_PEP_ID=MMETSP0958-20121227/9014_1 /TAXON_ID=87120 /ORGANISM="Aurantiochytrium limacinum, Strain ATCCMYA-1381" /LENGTH=264 /DNA_ID=CAMNT_0012035165 /DNA_START=164 /DNA_END=958 /DNA_ORIENTATION=-
MVVETLQTALAPLEPWLGRALSERQLQIVLTSFTVLNILYPIVAWMSARFVPQYKNFHPDERIHWNSMILSFTHATLVSGICASLVLFPDYAIEVDREFGYSKRAATAFAISSGFFLYDIKNCFKSTGPQWAYIFHHVACFFCYECVQYPFLPYYAVRFLLFELSTPFMNTRSVLMLLGRKDTALFKAIEHSFVLSFLVVRILMGIPLSIFAFIEAYDMYMASRQHSTFIMAFFTLANFGLNALNLNWLSIMMGKFFERYKKKD